MSATDTTTDATSNKPPERFSRIIPQPNGIEIQSIPMPFNPGFYWTDPTKEKAEPILINEYRVRLLSMKEIDTVNACKTEEEANRSSSMLSVVSLGPVTDKTLILQMLPLMLPLDAQRMSKTIARLRAEFADPDED